MARRQRVHDLGAGRPVEPGDGRAVGAGPAERGEAGADGGDVPVGHHASVGRAAIGGRSGQAGRPGLMRAASDSVASMASGRMRVRLRPRGAGRRCAQEDVTRDRRAAPGRGGPEIENLMVEGRTFPPDPAFSAQANAGPDLYVRADADFEAFWAELAREKLRWQEPFTTTLTWELPFARWFEDGRLNVSENCLDRHVEAGLGDKVAYHWIGEPGDTRTLTYADLHREVQKAANALLELGRADRRPGGHLHAHDPGAAHRHAGLRAHRGAPYRRLRRLLGRGAGEPHRRCPGHAPRHGRRRLAPWHARST